MAGVINRFSISSRGTFRYIQLTVQTEDEPLTITDIYDTFTGYPFSLWYIGMLYNYWMYRPDAQFVKEKLSGTRTIHDSFSK